jgi:hypothetical protein
MSSNGQVVPSTTPSTSGVATNEGKVVQVPDLTVAASRIYNFVTQYRKEYFEDHSLDWCLDEIVTRGCAEITRQVKTARERAKEKAAGSLLKEFNLSAKDAKDLLLKMLAEQRAAAQADASKAKPS